MSAITRCIKFIHLIVGDQLVHFFAGPSEENILRIVGSRSFSRRKRIIVIDAVIGHLIIVLENGSIVINENRVDGFSGNYVGGVDLQIIRDGYLIVFKDDVAFKYADNEDVIKRLCGLK